MTGSRFLVAAAAGLAVAGPAAAAELNTNGSSRTIEASASDLLVMADQLAKRGERAQAERVFDLLSRDPNRDVRKEARYRHSLLLETQGADKAAAVLLREILDENPDAAPVRLKLAAMLQKMGDEDSALRELRALRSADLPPLVARFVDRISATLQASKPFGMQIELALAPDSNINRATQSDTLGTTIGDFTFDEDGKQKSGVGVAARAVAHRRLPLGQSISMVARASADLNLYRDKRFNEIFAELSAGPEFRLIGMRFTAEAGLGHRRYGMKPYERQLRISGSASRQFDGVSLGRIDATLRRSDNMVNDLQDGRGLTLRARYERALSPQMSVAASLLKDRFDARDDAYSTSSWAAGLNLYRDIGRIGLNLLAEVGRLKADQRLEILPAARADKLIRFSAGAVFRQLTVEGFAPTARIIIERNRSTVEFYDYKRTRTEFGVTRGF